MNERDAQNGSKGIKSIRRSFDIVELIKREGPIRATTIADRVDCSQSTAHYYLKTLQDCGYVVQHDDGYALGVRFLYLGGDALVYRDLRDALHSEIHTLALDVGEPVQIAVEEYGTGYYIAHAPGNGGGGTERHVGAAMQLHTTAAGKLILAAQSSERRARIVGRSGLEARTEHTITDRNSLEEELQQIIEDGVAYEVRECSEDESAMAVPLARGSETVGALELTLPPTRIPDPRKQSKAERFPEELVNKTKETAETIEDRINT